MTDESAILPVKHIETLIHLIRGERIILDTDLARLYGVETRSLIQAVKRNLERFPDDFMFRLTSVERDCLTSQIVMSKSRGGRRTMPYAFTEQGVAMLSSVLNSPTAIQVNVEIIRAFVRIRKMMSLNADLAKKIVLLERKYDAQFKVVFDAIRELMAPQVKERRRIGFRQE
jgi:hypothetical protein